MNRDRIAFIKGTLDNYRVMLERYLSESSDARRNGVPEKLYRATEYSLAAGGKRLRPALCLAAAERCGCAAEDALPLALGIEMLHTATLIHDDLPCMDNDDMRRGRPSNHVMFGETMAVLAGDALLAQAIEYPLLYTNNVPPKRLLKALSIFSSAIGPAGVCGGQVLDMDASGHTGDPDYVRRTASLKTGALISAAVTSGAALGTDSWDTLKCYYNYGTHLGSAFQILDDILDATSSAEELGKTPGKDVKDGKLTHVTVYGIEQARIMAEDESLLAREAVMGILPDDDFLLGLTDYLIYRTF